MVFHKLLYLVVFVTVLLSGIVICQDETVFAAAISAVKAEKVKTNNINYATFCTSDSVNNVDDNFFGCQLQAQNGFELRVCKTKSGCDQLVNSSIDFNKYVHQHTLSIVRFSTEVLTGLKCHSATPVDNTCMGHMEEWLATNTAKWKQVNKAIFEKKEDALIEEIKTYQTNKAAKDATIADLQKILTWMTPPDGQCTNYKQLCGLEGFFKQNGGFFITNPDVKFKMMPEDFCYDSNNDPTTEQVVAFLEKFIKELS